MASRSRRNRRKKKKRTSSPPRKKNPVAKSKTTKTPSTKPNNPPLPEGFWRIGLIVCTILLILGMLIQTGLKGKDFLTFYMYFWFVIFAVSGILKANIGTAPVILGVLTFELLGFGRIVYGTNMGMARFDNLYIGMLVGGLFFLAYFTSFESSGNNTSGTGSNDTSSFYSSSSCGSSCGGDGCGSSCGGGCGGCS